MLVLNIAELLKFTVTWQKSRIWHVFISLLSAVLQRSSRALGSHSAHRHSHSQRLLSQTQLLGMSVLSLKKEQQLEKENKKKIQFMDGKQSFLWLEISGVLGKQGWQTHFKKYSI